MLIIVRLLNSGYHGGIHVPKLVMLRIPFLTLRPQSPERRQFDVRLSLCGQLVTQSAGIESQRRTPRSCRSKLPSSESGEVSVVRLQFAQLEDPSSSSRSVYSSLGQVVNGHLIARLLKVSQKIEGQCLNSMNKRRGVVQLEQKALSLVLFRGMWV